MQWCSADTFDIKLHRYADVTILHEKCRLLECYAVVSLVRSDVSENGISSIIGELGITLRGTSN
jgi:hypothetical protein